MVSERVSIRVTTDPMFGENSYVVSAAADRDCWLIDPGLPPHAAEMTAYVQGRGLTAAAIVLTHAHGDHIAGIDGVVAALGPLPIYLAREEWAALSDPRENLSSNVGLGVVVRHREPLHDLVPGRTLTLDGLAWSVLDTSGHSPGGRSLYCAEAGVVIVGDALFEGGIGRVDFHHSDGDRLLRNIRDQLLTLPDDTRVLSGHGGETTIGRERRTNPFLAAL